MHTLSKQKKFLTDSVDYFYSSPVFSIAVMYTKSSLNVFKSSDTLLRYVLVRYYKIQLI